MRAWLLTSEEVNQGTTWMRVRLIDWKVFTKFSRARFIVARNRVTPCTGFTLVHRMVRALSLQGCLGFNYQGKTTATRQLECGSDRTIAVAPCTIRTESHYPRPGGAFEAEERHIFTGGISSLVGPHTKKFEKVGGPEYDPASLHSLLGKNLGKNCS